MNNEIKEILDKLKGYENYKYRSKNGKRYKELEAWEIDILLDYITNLQLEQTKKVFDTIEKLILTDKTCTYRYLIYDLLGFDGSAYVPLIGGLSITNMLCEYQELKQENKMLSKECDTYMKVSTKKQQRLEEKDKKIDSLNEQVQIMEKYFELIVDLGYDYDGFSKEKDLKSLIDELCRLASLGRACNATDCIYENNNKKYNILHEELKGDNNE